MQVHTDTGVKPRRRSKAAANSPINELVDKVLQYQPGADVDRLREAYRFTAEVHDGQKRLSGEPYVVHPVAVAGVLADLKLDLPSVIGGLLHDTVEDTLATLPEIRKVFGEEIAILVDGVTKLSRVDFTSHEEKQAENFRKMIMAMAKDIRVVLIKLADRTHNMRTLQYLAPEKQRRIAQETLDIYAPIAHRLGIYWVKSELEDLALKHLRPEIYAQLKQDVAQKKKHREKYINDVISRLSKALAEEGIDAEVSGRPKHFYSIFKKMEDQSLDFEQVYDVVAFRIVVDTVRECYESMGIVHSKWRPVPGRFKDYIALAKPNMYQSLHTTVLGPNARRIEIQIRTHDMHRGGGGGDRFPLAVQGGQGAAGDRHPAVHVADPAPRMAAEPVEPSGVPPQPQGGFVPGRSLRVHAQRRPAGLPQGGDGGRFRLPYPFRHRAALLRRACERQAGALQVHPQERRYGGDHHHRRADAEPGLVEGGQDAPRQVPDPGLDRFSATRAERGPGTRDPRGGLRPVTSWTTSTCSKRAGSTSSARSWGSRTRKGFWRAWATAS